MEKLPPIEKIYEAYSALADGRVQLKEEASQATVTSSDGSKHYTITWKDGHYTSNDSATYWAGYPGYPVLAVWMKQGILPCNMEIAKQFAGVGWKELNQQFKRKYDKAVASVMEARQLDAETITTDVQQVYEAVKALELTVGRGKGRP